MLCEIYLQKHAIQIPLEVPVSGYHSLSLNVWPLELDPSIALAESKTCLKDM